MEAYNAKHHIQAGNCGAVSAVLDGVRVRRRTGVGRQLARRRKGWRRLARRRLARRRLARRRLAWRGLAWRGLGRRLGRPGYRRRTSGRRTARGALRLWIRLWVPLRRLRRLLFLSTDV